MNLCTRTLLTLGCICCAGIATLQGQKMLAIYPSILDLPFQIYGGTVRIEPFQKLYIEGFGSWRPLREREFLFGSTILRGANVDLSVGLRFKKISADLNQSTIALGAVIQRIDLSGQAVACPWGGCAAIPGLGRELRYTGLGLRIGWSYKCKSGLYISANGGATGSKPPDKAKIVQSMTERKIDINHGSVFLHARLGIGYAFQW